jgi:hypothetical protein
MSRVQTFREREGLGWVDTKEKARGLLRRLGFRSGTHRRERFGDGDHPDTMRETARDYEGRFDAVQSLLSRYSSAVEPSQASHSHGQKDSAHLSS